MKASKFQGYYRYVMIPVLGVFFAAIRGKQQASDTVPAE